MSVLQSMPTPSDAGGEAFPDHEAPSAVALARATAARIVAVLFAEPTETDGARWDGTVLAEIRQAAAVLGLSEAAARVLGHSSDFADRQAEYHHLFGHTARSSCPPYELEFRHAEIFQSAQTLADIAGFYAAFGFEACGPAAERADHVVAQWEFLSVLALQEHAAYKCDDAQGAACCRDAQKAFLSDHAAAWMPAFFARIRKAAPAGHYGVVADFAEAVLCRICRDFDVHSGPDWLELRPVTDEDSSITCGEPGAAEVELGPRLAAALGAGD